MSLNANDSDMAVNITVNNNTPERGHFPEHTFAILDRPGINEDIVDQVAAHGGPHYNVVVLQHSDFFDFIHGNHVETIDDAGIDEDGEPIQSNGFRGASALTAPPLPALLPRIGEKLSSIDPQAGIVNPLVSPGPHAPLQPIPRGYYTPERENLPIDQLEVMLADMEERDEKMRRKMASMTTFSEQLARDKIKKRYPRPVVTKEQRESEKAAAEQKLVTIMAMYGLGGASKAPEDGEDVEMTDAF